jgi:hypothetical protein
MSYFQSRTGMDLKITKIDILPAIVKKRKIHTAIQAASPYLEVRLVKK